MKKQVFLDSMGFLLFVGALVVALVVLAGVGCGKGESPTGIDMPDVAQAAPAPQQATAAQTAPGQEKGVIRADGSFSITNSGGAETIFYAYLYEVFPGGEQQYRGFLQSPLLAPGQRWDGEFETLPCNWQIDLSAQKPGTFTHPSAGGLGHRISQGNVCDTPCEGRECEPTPPPQCEGDDCEPPACEGDDCPCIDDCEPEEPDYCYYEVDCGFSSSGRTSCDKEDMCEEEDGEWGKWYKGSFHVLSGDKHEQCRIEFPGVSDRHFQLNPGQSAKGCLSKHED